MNPARTYLRVDVNGLQDNYKHLRSFVPEKVRLICIVKDDGYGIGAVPEAMILQNLGADFFGTACASEGHELRASGIRGDILLLGHSLKEDIDTVLEDGLIQTVGDAAYGRLLAEAARKRGIPARVHFKIDTGMHRLGISDRLDLSVLKELYDDPYLKVEGAFTHFAAADSYDADDRAFSKKQYERFVSWLEKAEKAGMKFACTHAAASAAIVNYPEYLDSFTACRPGILFPGFDSGDMDYPYPRREIISLRSHVTKIDVLPAGESIGYGRTFTADHEIKVATICAGYGDGVPRNYKGGEVLIRGKRCPVIGRISMDQMCVDAGALEEVSIGDDVVLLGNDENETITLKEMSSKAGTIPNETILHLTDRVGRFYE